MSSAQALAPIARPDARSIARPPRTGSRDARVLARRPARRSALRRPARPSAGRGRDRRGRGRSGGRGLPGRQPSPGAARGARRPSSARDRRGRGMAVAAAGGGAGAGAVAVAVGPARAPERSAASEPSTGCGRTPGARRTPERRSSACAGIVVVAAAALAFWPGERRRAGRRLTALALLLALYITGAVNESRTGWQVQGAVLLAALYLLAWADRTWRRDDGRAGAWMLALAAVSVLGAGAMAGSSPLINFRAWNPFGPAFAPTAFSWNQTYGPLPWSSSSETMVLVELPHPAAVAGDRARQLRRRPVPALERPAVRSAGRQRRKAQTRRWITRATFTVRGLSSRLLLSPGEILAVGLQGEPTPNLEAAERGRHAGALGRTAERHPLHGHRLRPPPDGGRNAAGLPCGSRRVPALHPVLPALAIRAAACVCPGATDVARLASPPLGEGSVVQSSPRRRRARR